MNAPQTGGAPDRLISETAREEAMESRRATTEQRRERAELDARYGKIGISAVAAALRYRGDAKNPAYAPTPIPATEHEDAA
jgi:hypothetical protein